MKTIKLHGVLSGFGGPFVLDVQSAAEAIRALSVQLPGFRETLSEGSFRVVLEKKGKKFDLDEVSLSLSSKKQGTFHLVPIIAGAKNRAVGKVIAGVALAAIGGGLFPGRGAFSRGLMNMGRAGARTALSKSVGLLGVSLALGGVAQLLSPVPEVDNYADRAAVDQRPSLLFTGPINVTAQGGPVPVAYGTCMVGSVVVSAGITTETLP